MHNAPCGNKSLSEVRYTLIKKNPELKNREFTILKRREEIIMKDTGERLKFGGFMVKENFIIKK